jgi:hypothetical protein
VSKASFFFTFVVAEIKKSLAYVKYDSLHTGPLFCFFCLKETGHLDLLFVRCSFKYTVRNLFVYLVAVFTKNSNEECFVICRHGRHLHLMVKIVPQLKSQSIRDSNKNNYYFNLLESCPAWIAGKWGKRSSLSEGDLQSKFYAPGGRTPEYDRESLRCGCPPDKLGNWLSTHSPRTAKNFSRQLNSNENCKIHGPCAYFEVCWEGTCCSAHSGKTCPAHQSGRCRSHHSDTGSCPHRRTVCTPNRYTES